MARLRRFSRIDAYWDFVPCIPDFWADLGMEAKEARERRTGRTPLTGGQKSRRIEKEEHSFVSCGYERKHHRTNECIRGILPESQVPGKRENRRGQYHQSWKETPALSVQNVREDGQCLCRNNV